MVAKIVKSIYPNIIDRSVCKWKIYKIIKQNIWKL